MVTGQGSLLHCGWLILKNGIVFGCELYFFN